MDSNKLYNGVLFKRAIGELSIQAENVERIIDNILCEYFIASDEKKRKIFIETILNRTSLKFEDKMECLRLMAFTIKNEKTRNDFRSSINSADNINERKNDFIYGKLNLSGNIDKVKVEIITDTNFKKKYCITPETIKSIRFGAESIIGGLYNAKCIINENT